MYEMMDELCLASQDEAEEMDGMRARMSGFILPNVPVTGEETRAFEQACLCQIRHERKKRSALSGAQLPEGATGFTVGHFQMSFEEGALSSALTRKTICDAAYALLARAGLLYRGVERGRNAWP